MVKAAHDNHQEGCRAARGEPRLEERVAGFFASDGPLAKRKPGYAPRDQQLGYALAVARAIDDAPTERPAQPPDEAEPGPDDGAPPSLLLADCPTGTGKTLASLVPAALSGLRAIYSTATINLQGQLLNSELPLLARSLGTGPATDGAPVFTYALLKGRANYLCDNRLDALFCAPPSLESVGSGPSPEESRDLATWRAATPTGERDDFPGRPSLWSQVAADPNDCAPLSCRFREACFYLRSAKAARNAQVLVVNHALLAANLVAKGALFPMDDRALIIDEAHRLHEALSAAYGAHLTLGKTLHLSRSALRRDPARASRYADALDWAAERFFRELENVAPGAVEHEDALPDPEALAGALVALRNVLRGSPAGQARAVAGMAKQLLRDLRSFYKGRETHARAVLAREGGRAHELRSWLVDVGPAFAWDVAARKTGAETGEADAEEPGRGPVTVLCSATLATGSGPKRSFAHARRALGVNLLLKTRPGTRYEEHRAEEAFDYPNRALLYVERRLPEPTRDNAEEYARLCALRTAELLEASRGRALVLLSTARAVRLFREHLIVPYPVRYQTDGAPTGPLVEWLKTTPAAVLVGTRSLWEGVDVSGPQVSLVVIDKVPFTAPNDPLNKALAERAGKGWFHQVSLPAAQVALRQGAGRLIRSASDRGVLALLDPRVSARSWGRQVVSSLPPAPATDSIERVRRFLAD